jgi:DNA/RNA-binding domain of Phe-tRNA-synthetase-like protein
MVDLVNLVSMRFGYSIGGFDADKVVGNVVAGIGREGEPYNGIGRGPLNIACLPVLRDSVSGFGTPTSDEERTAMSLETSHFLMVVNAYDGPELLPELFDYTRQLLEKYADAKDIETKIVRH